MSGRCIQRQWTSMNRRMDMMKQPFQPIARRYAEEFASLNANLTPNQLSFESSVENISTNVSKNVTQDEIDSQGDLNKLFYLYGTLSLIIFCIISIAINIRILISVFWARRPISPTLYISLSLAGADAFSSLTLGIGLIVNSLIPHGLDLKLNGMDCFLVGLEAIRLGAVIVTVSHLMALAVNHYIGILKPLQYLSIMTHRSTTFLIILLWLFPLTFFVVYFSLIENEGFRSKECKINTFLYFKKFRIIFSCFFFGPLFIMACIYVHIFRIVKKHQALRLRFARTNASFYERDTKHLRNTTQQIMKNVKAMQTTFYILGSFVVGWIPATVMYVIVCEDCILRFNWTTDYIKLIVYIIINCLIILKTLVNPIIYAARMQEIKAATRRMDISCYECFGFSGYASDDDRNSDRKRSFPIVERHYYSTDRNLRTFSRYKSHTSSITSV
ncbi:adenosine receptor A3-like [Prorops nasuta]|uniref:adenosine receptor A3-like n=1 Tax=Prorops nasuta TaxID=863751 RepID=UPI0034CF8348